MRLVLVLALSASAQFWDPKKETSPPPAETPEQQETQDVGGMKSSEPPPPAEAGEGGEPKVSDAPPAPASLQDARENFTTVVETFLVQNTKDGVWNLRDKRTKKIRRLTLVKIDDKSVRNAAKPGHFRGRVRFQDVSGKPVVMEMTVDMSGAQWRVAGARMLGAQK